MEQNIHNSRPSRCHSVVARLPAALKAGCGARAARPRFFSPERRPPCQVEVRLRLVSHVWEKAPEGWAHSKTQARMIVAPAVAERLGVCAPMYRGRFGLPQLRNDRTEAQPDFFVYFAYFAIINSFKFKAIQGDSSLFKPIQAQKYFLQTDLSRRSAAKAGAPVFPMSIGTR